MVDGQLMWYLQYLLLCCGCIVGWQGISGLDKASELHWECLKSALARESQCNSKEDQCNYSQGITPIKDQPG